MSFRKSISRNQADAHFSYCVRAAARWCCQRCGKSYEDKNRQGLQCSHFIGRGNWAVRYDTALSLCANCHGFVEQHPIEHTRLFTEHIGGEEELQKYLQRSECKSRAQWARANWKTISKHYLAERKRLDNELLKENEDEMDLNVYRYRQDPPAL